MTRYARSERPFLALVGLVLLAASCAKPRENIALDLTAELPQAKIAVPELGLLSGAAWKPEYGTWGWKEDRSMEPGAALLPLSQSRAVIPVAALAEQDLRFRTVLKPLAGLGASSRIEVRFNGALVYESGAPGEDDRAFEFHAPAGLVHPGENLLEFRIAGADSGLDIPYALAIREVRLRPGGAFRTMPPERSRSLVRVVSERTRLGKRRGLEQPLNTAVSYSLKIPPRAHFLFGLALETPDPLLLEGERFCVVLSVASGESRVLLEHTYTPRSPLRASSLDVDLTAFSGQMARLSLVFMKESAGRSHASRLRFWEPRIVIRPEPTEPTPARPRRQALAKPFNILIYLVDSLRADMLPFIDPSAGPCPNFENFARDSVVLRNSFAQGTWTRPSVGALFTGLHPFAHTAVTLRRGLPAELTTLAEVFHGAGYSTVGISSNAGVKEFFNFHQGFQSFTYHSSLSGGNSEKLNAYAFDTLRLKPQPLFLYLHTMDLHRPYPLKEEFLPSPPPKGRTGPLIPVVEQRRKGEVRYLVDLEDVRAHYAAALRQTDHSFGQLTAELKKLGLYDSTLIVLMADHGEGFYEHGLFAHGHSLYQEELRQLIVVKLPGQQNAGATIDEPVQTIDLFPTLLELVGKPAAAYLQGRSLAAKLLDPRSTRLPPAEIFAETEEKLKYKTLVDWPWKIIHKSQKWTDSLREWELYNLELDPKEKDDLFTRNPVAREYLKRRLQAWAENQPRFARIAKGAAERALTEKEVEELKALGYIR